MEFLLESWYFTTWVQIVPQGFLLLLVLDSGTCSYYVVLCTTQGLLALARSERATDAPTQG